MTKVVGVKDSGLEKIVFRKPTQVLGAPLSSTMLEDYKLNVLPATESDILFSGLPVRMWVNGMADNLKLTLPGRSSLVCSACCYSLTSMNGVQIFADGTDYVLGKTEQLSLGWLGACTSFDFCGSSLEPLHSFLVSCFLISHAKWVDPGLDPRGNSLTRFPSEAGSMGSPKGFQ